MRNYWKEIIIGTFFIAGIFTGLHMQDPFVQVLQTLTNMTANTPVHAAEINNLHWYIIATTVITGATAIGILFVLGIFGGVSIITAYASGSFISHNAWVGVILLFASWLCIWYGNERRKKGLKLFILF